MCMQSPSKCMQTNPSLDLACACCQKLVDKAKHIVDLMNVQDSKNQMVTNVSTPIFIFTFFHSCSLMEITIHLFLLNTIFYFFHYESHFC
jgi:hypothetical protein